MKYPVDVDTYLQTMRESTGYIAPEIEACQRQFVVPLVNRAYFDGLEGLGGWPLEHVDFEDLIEYLQKRNNRHLDSREIRFLSVWVMWCNEAYRTGRAIWCREV